jgi:dolichol-phosphate mannosyltransferase
MSGDHTVKLSIIIPVYNEELTIADVLRAVADTPADKEIIVVNDGSTDGTKGALESARPYVTHIHHASVNGGKGAAIRTGLKYVSGDVVLIQDADLELDPREHQALLQPILDGRTNVVYGSRFLLPNPAIPAKTVAANRFLTWLTNSLFGSRLTDMETAFKAFRSEIICSLPLTCRRFEFEPEVTAELLRRGHQILEVPVSYRPRTTDEGKKIRPRDGVVAIWTLLKCRFRTVRRQ